MNEGEGKDPKGSSSLTLNNLMQRNSLKSLERDLQTACLDTRIELRGRLPLEDEED